MAYTKLALCGALCFALAACSGGASTTDDAGTAMDASAPAEAVTHTAGLENSGGDGESDNSTANAMGVECRKRAANEYGVDRSSVASIEIETARVDGSTPFNGELQGGQRFQCNFNAAGQLFDFIKVTGGSDDTDETTQASSDTGLESFEGARAGQAEMGIQALGYEIVENQGLTNLWYNKMTGQCYAVTTNQGRYASIKARDASECAG